MMRSLFAGVQGLRAHQVKMDVIGNNIANVNTTGFKASRVSFAEMYSETIAGAAAPGNGRGGINPKQIGLGVGVASIDTVMAAGSLQLTGKATDMAISGNGFFVMRDGDRFVYTRAGNFDFDAEGYLVNPSTGQRVQGWLPQNGVFPSREGATMTDIQLPVADSVLAQATNLVTFDQSLNALATTWETPGAGPAPAPTHTTAFKVIDSLGKEHSITLNLFKVNDNTWDVQAWDGTTQLALTGPSPAYGSAGAPALNASAAPAGGTPKVFDPLMEARLQFNTDGSLQDTDAIAGLAASLAFTPGGGASPMTVDLDFTKVIQPALKGTGTSTLRAFDYNGYPTGALNKIGVDAAGVVTGYYTNGQYREVAQVALANFFNPAGLVKDSNNNWVESPNSGLALVGAAGQAGRGTIAPNNLEMSNVDISAEFTDMIITQRGFQANSRIITATDELLQEVVNLKR